MAKVEYAIHHDKRNFFLINLNSITDHKVLCWANYRNSYDDFGNVQHPIFTDNQQQQ